MTEMQYKLPHARPGRVEFDLDQAMPYGDMPMSMLAAKFEETDLGPDEDVYDFFARGVLTDRRPDTNNQMEHERPRGGVNASSGRLQLQYYGHRGNADDPAHPEVFLGFAGEDEVDPRGTADGPDIKKLREQEQARMRFQRFTPDGGEQVTGGGRSESQTMADQQKLFKWTKDRLKVFSRQLDGRREGMRRPFTPHSSAGKNQVVVQSYGDKIASDALTPQRQHVALGTKLIRDLAWFRADNTDSDFAVAKYTQLGRKRQTKNSQDRLRVIASDTDYSESDMTKCYRAVALMMADLSRAKRNREAVQDTDYGKSDNTQARKTAEMSRDLGLILRAMVEQHEWGTSQNTVSGKTATPKRNAHLANVISLNHLIPAHHLLNAEIIYQTAKRKGDLRKLHTNIITDASVPTIQDTKTMQMKSGRRDFKFGAKNDSHIEVEDQTRKTANYKHVRVVNGDKKTRLQSNHDITAESDNSQVRRPNQGNWRVTQADDYQNDMELGDNAKKERLGGHLGSKYTMRQISRDSDTSDFKCSS